MSSHNTYVDKPNQCWHNASYKAYRYQLLKGVRSVELDIYDDKNSLSCRIMHASDFISGPVDLESVLRAIKETAFVASDYPVILSLENHVKKKECLESLTQLLIKFLGKENIMKYKDLADSNLWDCKGKFVVIIYCTLNGLSCIIFAIIPMDFNLNWTFELVLKVLFMKIISSDSYYIFLIF